MTRREMYLRYTYLYVLVTETLQLLKLLLHLFLVLRHQVLLLNLILLVRQTLNIRLNFAQAVVHSITDDISHHDTLRNSNRNFLQTRKQVLTALWTDDTVRDPYSRCLESVWSQ